MEVVRKFIDGDSLMTVMSLPEHFRKHRLEVLVMSADDEQKPDSSNIDAAILALTGAVPCTDMSLEEFREERLRKYENID